MLSEKLVYPSEPISFSIEKRKYSKLKDGAEQKALQEKRTLNKDDWEDMEFGDRYAGAFTFRVPSLADQTEVAKLHAVRMASQGPIDPTLVDGDLRSVEYVFALSEVCLTQKPDWFDRTKLWSGQDRLAVLEVLYAFNEGLLALKKKFVGN